MVYIWYIYGSSMGIICYVFDYMECIIGGNMAMLLYSTCPNAETLLTVLNNDKLFAQAFTVLCHTDIRKSRSLPDELPREHGGHKATD